MSGEELTRMIRQEDFQWVWGALLAFSTSCSKEQILSGVRALYVPEASDQDSWHIRNRFLETGAEFMIYAEQSSAACLYRAAAPKPETAGAVLPPRAWGGSARAVSER